MRFDRRFLTNFDWWTLLFSMAIALLSLVLLYSATYSGQHNAEITGVHLKQLSWMGLGVISMLVVLCIDYQFLCRHAYVLYGILLASLVLVLLFGRVVNGSQRWLVIGPWRLQTSELAKPIMILVLARQLVRDAEQDTAPLTLRDLLLPMALVVLPFFLIVKQPNLSTAMVLVAITSAMVLVAGTQAKTLLGLLGTGVGILPLAWYVMKDYQRERVLTLLNPQSDMLGSGYHSWQSKIAIGSGGWWGKGLFASTQSRLSFLPEKHTDFIFAVLAEEMGFVGVLLLLCVFGALLTHGVIVAYRSRDRLGALIVTGVIAMVAVQVFLNIGMTVGLLPIIGLPLPLMSYGGSSLLMTFMCLGLLMNVRMRRFKYSGLSP